MIRNCAKCRSPFRTKACLVARGQGKFCSKRCADDNLRTGKVVLCHACSRSIYRPTSILNKAKTATYFCGPGCRSNWSEKVMPSGTRHHNWKYGLRAYRRMALKEYGKRCHQCGYSKDARMLDVDHRNGNRKNNSVENLMVLCVWCHAAKTRGVAWHPWGGK